MLFDVAAYDPFEQLAEGENGQLIVFYFQEVLRAGYRDRDDDEQALARLGKQMFDFD